MAVVLKSENPYFNPLFRHVIFIASSGYRIILQFSVFGTLEGLSMVSIATKHQEWRVNLIVCFWVWRWCAVVSFFFLSFFICHSLVLKFMLRLFNFKNDRFTKPSKKQQKNTKIRMKFFFFAKEWYVQPSIGMDVKLSLLFQNNNFPHWNVWKSTKAKKKQIDEIT